MKKEIVLCSCGGVTMPYHPVGEGNCLRYHVTEINEIPTNRRQIYNPEWFEENTWVWDIDGAFVTEYTVFNQRMYSQDENGNWTRPKSRDSINSIEVD